MFTRYLAHLTIPKIDKKAEGIRGISPTKACSYVGDVCGEDPCRPRPLK